MIRYFRTFLRYRELLYFLILREIKAKYKQTFLGVAWAVLQPLALMTTFTVVFSLFAKLPSDGVPYAVFSYCGLLPWQFFAGVLGRGVGGLLSNQGLVQKVYFPREIIPVAIVAAAGVDFAIGACLFGGLLWFYGIPLAFLSLWVVPIILVQLCFVLGLILILSPLNVFYRDIALVIPLVVQIWMYATPIIYPLRIVPERFRTYFLLNPMAGVIDAYRQLLLHHSAPDPTSIAFATGVSLATLAVGIVYFKRVEFQLADVM